MKNFLKINWRELDELSKRTATTADLFEEGRYNFYQIVKSLNECWEGKDATAFINNASIYLEYLKGDSQYLTNLSKYYNRSAKGYNEVVDENSENIKKIRELNEKLGDKI